MVCENNCMNEQRIAALAKELEEFKHKNSQDHEKFYGRIEDTEKRMIESQGDRQNIRDKLDEISGDVKTIMQRPAKRYDTLITSALTGIVGAIIGFLMNGLLPIR